MLRKKGVFLYVYVGRVMPQGRKQDHGGGRTAGLINSTNPEIIDTTVGEEGSTHCQFNNVKGKNEPVFSF